MAVPTNGGMQCLPVSRNAIVPHLCQSLAGAWPYPFRGLPHVSMLVPHPVQSGGAMKPKPARTVPSAV